jgi:hypothetical protein
MSTKQTSDQDSLAQRRQAGESKQNRREEGLPADKKLDGPNRPSV